MSRRRAPMASRSPISRVRSVTLTSMMFITPMPPTSSDTAATAASRVESVRAEASRVAATSAMLRIATVSGSFAATRWRWRKRVRSSSSTARMSSPSCTFTAIQLTERNQTRLCP
jgi:hypothetical protein